MDFSLGQFMKNASEADYFDNTLFVVFGDHGSYGYHLNKSHGDLTIHEYHVPMIFYGPGLNILPSIHEKVVSEIDIFPSIFSLLNIPHENHSLGRKFLENPKTEQLAFLFSASSQRYGLVTNSQNLIHSTTESYNLFDPFDISSSPIELEISSKSENLVTLSTGFYETARYLRHANSRGIK